MLALRNRAVLSRAPSFARHLRVTPPALKAALTSPTSGGAVIDPKTYFDGESLAAHQERVRIADPGNRTYNYAMIGATTSTAPPPPPSCAAQRAADVATVGTWMGKRWGRM